MTNVIIDITPGPDPENPTAGASGTIAADDVTEDAVVQLGLMFLESFVAASVRRQLEEALPMGNAEVLDALTMQNARLALLHEVMHLPATQPFAAQIDL